jgi:hypothetical protein
VQAALDELDRSRAEASPPHQPCSTQARNQTLRPEDEIDLPFLDIADDRLESSATRMRTGQRNRPPGAFSAVHMNSASEAFRTAPCRR